MKNKIFKFARVSLMIWGGISLAILILIAGYLIYLKITPINARNKADVADVRFVLNWCELGDKRIERVVQSYTSERTFTGDHLDAYAIKISNVTIEELTTKKENGHGQWYRADSLPDILNKATEFISVWHDEIPWFPKEEAIRSKQFYVYPWKINCNGITPSSVDLIFIKPNEKLVYFISLKV